MRKTAGPFLCLTLFLLAVVLVIAEVRLRAGSAQSHGQIIIPEDIFPEGRGLPIPIYLPPVANDSNAFFGDWKTVTAISGDRIRFSQEKLLRNLATFAPPRPLEGPEIDEEAAAAFALGAALIDVFAKAFEEEAFQITIQRGPQSNFRAVIQLATDEMNIIRDQAGGAISSSSAGPVAVAWSRYLQERFLLPSTSSPYRSIWTIDRKHQKDPYVAYLTLRPEQNAVAITPKIYSGDSFKIMKEIFIVGPIVLEIKGKEYVDTWSYSRAAQASESLKILKLVGIRQPLVRLRSERGDSIAVIPIPVSVQRSVTEISDFVFTYEVDVQKREGSVYFRMDSRSGIVYGLPTLGMNGYGLIFCPFANQGANPGLYLVKRVNGLEKTLASTARGFPRQSGRTQLTLSVKGNLIQVYENNRLVLSVTDGSFQGGRLLWRVYGDPHNLAEAIFRQISLTTVSISD